MRTHVDLFTGLGGFTIAAAINGVRTIAMCEIDPRCRAFLAQAWPGIPIWDDVRTFRLANAESGNGGRFTDSSEQGAFGRTPHRRAGEIPWLLTAGVPCQPASRAGKQRGAADDRWLWEPTLAVLANCQPTWALLENPPGIGDVGLAGILSQVGACGYEVRVFGLPACAVGAPHRRERYWIVAHRAEPRHEGCEPGHLNAERLPSEHGAGDVADAKWGDCVWLPCADGKVRRAPDDTQRLAHGLPVELLEILGTEGFETPEDCEVHRSVLAALGNAITWPVASKIIAAMIEAEAMEGSCPST